MAAVDNFDYLTQVLVVLAEQCPGICGAYTVARAQYRNRYRGGTAIKAGLVDPSGSLVKSLRRDSIPSDPDQIVGHTIELVRELSEGIGTFGVGVAVAAFLDPTRDTVVLSPNISWENRPLRRELEEALGVPVLIENDANAAAWGEFLRGAGMGTTSMVMFTLGTGIGGAVIVDGELLVGARGIAGELGHVIVEPDGPLCGCGQYGCLEAVASATAFVREYRLHTGDTTVTTAILEGSLASAPNLAAELYLIAARGLATAVLNIQAVLDPECVVIGGGMADKAGGVLGGLISDELSHLVRDRRSAALPDIRLAELGNHAGVLGVALAARARAERAG